MEPTKPKYQRKGRPNVSPELRERMQAVRWGQIPKPMSEDLAAYFNETGRRGGLQAAANMTAEERRARTIKGNHSRRLTREAEEKANIDDDAKNKNAGRKRQAPQGPDTDRA